jgi:hypothetical protein
VKIGQSVGSSIRRKAKAGNHAIGRSLAVSNDIAPADHRKLLSQQSVFGLIAELTKEKNLPALKEEASAPLPYAVTARMFLDAVSGR